MTIGMHLTKKGRTVKKMDETREVLLTEQSRVLFGCAERAGDYAGGWMQREIRADSHSTAARALHK